MQGFQGLFQIYHIIFKQDSLHGVQAHNIGFHYRVQRYIQALSWSYNVQEPSYHHVCGCQTFSCIMTISKGSMTSTRATRASSSSSSAHSWLHEHQVAHTKYVGFMTLSSHDLVNKWPQNGSFVSPRATKHTPSVNGLQRPSYHMCGYVQSINHQVIIQLETLCG